MSLDTEFTADEQLTDPVQRALQDFVNGLLGRELRVDFAWAGIFGLVMDFLPVVGRVPGSRTCGWPAGTPATAMCWASPAASSLRGRLQARTIRCCRSSNLPGC